VAAFVVAVAAVAIQVHYLCCKECGDLRRVATVTAVAIKVHYLCVSECGNLRRVATVYTTCAALNVVICEVWQRLL
jgi:hypothetical protein